MLLLTRMGEALFRYLRLRGVERFLHGPGNGLRRSMLNSIGSVSVRQFGLAGKGLVPAGHMEDIVKGAIGLATEGFFEGVADGAIVGAPRPDRRPAARRRRPAAALLRRRHPAAGRPRRVLDRLHPGRPVPGRRRAGPAVRRARELHALPADPAARRARACASTATTPRSSARSTPRWPRSGSPPTWPARLRLPGLPERRRAVTEQLAFMDRGRGRAPLPRHEDHPVLDAQRRRGARRPRRQHPRGGPGLALDQPRSPRPPTRPSPPGCWPGFRRPGRAPPACAAPLPSPDQPSRHLVRKDSP